MRPLARAVLVLAGLVATSVVGGVAYAHATPPNVQTSYVCPTSGWDVSDPAVADQITADQFHYDGLHLQVAGPTHKQSAYVTLPTPVKLSAINAGSDTGMTYQVAHGYAPGYQLTVLDEEGHWMGNLVREDGRWWATRTTNHEWDLVVNPGQSGSNPFDAFKTAYPNRVVYRAGFSLGSGAAASDGILKDLTFQGTRWTFTASCVHPTLPEIQPPTWTPGTRPSHPTTTTKTHPSPTSLTLSTTTVPPTTTTTTTPPESSPTTVSTTTRAATIHVEDRALPTTGASVGWLVALGGLLLLAGLSLVIWRVRRPTADDDR